MLVLLTIFLWNGIAIVALLLAVVIVGLVWLLKLCWNERVDPLRDLRGLEAPFFEPLCGYVTRLVLAAVSNGSLTLTTTALSPAYITSGCMPSVERSGSMVLER